MRGLAALLCGAFALYAGSSLARYHAMGANVFDLGIMHQTLWLLAHGYAPELSTRGLAAGADHFNPVAGLLAPLLWVYDSPVTLLVAQALILVSGAIPLYLMARTRGLSPGQRLGGCGLFLLQPGQLYLNGFDFHFTSLLVPALLWAAWALEENRPDVYSLALLITLGTTESAGFTVLLLAWPALRLRGKRWAAGTLVAAAVGLGVAGAAMRSQAYGAPTQYLTLYSAYGRTGREILAQLAAHPLEVAAGLATPVNRDYLSALLASWGWLPLLGPLQLAGALPVLLGNLLSWRSGQHELGLHYTAGILPFLAWSALAGLTRLPAQARGWVLALAAVPAVLLGPLARASEGAEEPPAGWSPWLRPTAERAVVTDNTLGTSMAGRELLFVLPNPWVAAAWGNIPSALMGTLSRTFPPELGELRRAFAEAPVDEVVLDLEGGTFPLQEPDRWFVLDALMRCPDYGVAHHDGRLLVLRRGAPHDVWASRMLVRRFKAPSP